MEAMFRHSHIDRAPLGNVRDTLLTFILTGAEGTYCDLHYRHSVDDREFEFDTVELKRELEGVSLAHPKVRDWLREYIGEGERELYGPVLKEIE